MKTHMAILSGVLRVFASLAQAETFSPCQAAAYVSGLEFFKQGKFQEASGPFFESITLDSQSDTEYIPCFI